MEKQNKARFCGIMQNLNRQVVQYGSDYSGIDLKVKGRNGNLEASMYIDNQGKEWMRITVKDKLIYDGPIDGSNGLG